MKDRATQERAGVDSADALEASCSLALAARRQHVDRVLQAMSAVSSPGRPEQLCISNGILPRTTYDAVEFGLIDARLSPSLSPASFLTPAHKSSQQKQHRRSQTSDIQDTVSGVRPHCQHTTYRVPGSPALADYSQSQTVNDFLRSCHSMRHTAEPPAMPPLPPDVGSSMEKLLLDQICQLCQERATLVAKQQSSEQLIKHLEERVTYLEDCLDHSASAFMGEEGDTEDGCVKASCPPTTPDPDAASEVRNP